MVKTKADKVFAVFISGIFTLTLAITTIIAIRNVDNSTRADGWLVMTPNYMQISSGGSHVMVINEGKLYGWGFNNSGRLGNGTTADSSTTTPIQIGTASNWVSVSCGATFSIVLNSLGELWSCGQNDRGQLGQASGVSADATLKKIGTKSNWITVSSGRFHSHAINSDGELWGWGGNDASAIGDTTSTSRNAPVRIGTATNWVSVAAGQNHSLAINSLGELWAWGYNYYGEVGDGTKTTRKSPVRIGENSNWVSATGGGGYSIALNSDGELWAWGNNNFGQLGDGTTLDKISPVQVGEGTKWIKVSANGIRTTDNSINNNHTVAINEDGELWTWGYNGTGELGDGTNVNRNSPVQIGIGTKWLDISTAFYSSAAINSLGEIWTWGQNSYAQLGLGDKINRNIPTLVNGIIIPVGDYMVVAPNSDTRFTISQSTTWVFHGEAYSITLVMNDGYSQPYVSLNNAKGNLTLTGAIGNAFTFTISNVQSNISPSDFDFTVTKLN